MTALCVSLADTGRTSRYREYAEMPNRFVAGLFSLIFYTTIVALTKIGFVRRALRSSGLLVLTCCPLVTASGLEAICHCRLGTYRKPNDEWLLQTDNDRSV